MEKIDILLLITACGFLITFFAIKELFNKLNN